MSDKQITPTLPPLTGGGGNNVGSNGGASQQSVSLQQVLASAQGLNVLSTSSGQQFVITSQVPGLTQVISNSATTNAGVQQIGVTRIVNIGGTSPRVSVVGVASASGSPLVSPTRQTPTKVVLATSPKLVRTTMGNMFVTPPSQSSVQSPPARKRLKLAETTEKVTAIDDTVGYRRRIMEHKMKRMRAIREKYAENASELFFLHAGGNMMDFQSWRKRPPTPQYLHFLRQHRLDPEDDEEDLTAPPPPMPDVSSPTVVTTTTVSSVVPSSSSAEVKISGIGITPVAVSTTLPAAVAQLSQQGGTPIVPEPPKPISAVPVSPVADKSPSASTSAKPPAPAIATSQPVVKLVKLSANSAASSCDIPNNQEQIVEKAKQEAYVMQRISELQREGLWSERRLPKVQEPSRTKAHWDYLLEEMVWLAADFAQERKWKKAAAKKCARMVQKHFQEKAIQAQKAEKSQELRLKKIAGFVAKEIKTFWTNVEKLVEYKQQTRLEEKRKKALDQHLNFIVGQTEKYSTWLTEGLNKTDGTQSVSASMNSSRISSPITAGKQHSDDEFEPNQSSDDDEETIAKAEEEMKSTTNHKEEVELLKKESEIPLEDLLKDLPPNYLEERDKSLSPAPKETVEVENEKSVDGDSEFMVASEESSDDEDTIMEQEKLEGNDDHKQELDDLKAENEMSIDELMAKYGSIPDDSMEVDGDTDRESVKESDKEEENENEEQSESESESEDETKGEDSQTQSDSEAGVGLKSLLEDLSTEKAKENKVADTSQTETRNEMDDVAALAESIQPKGNTLLTTSVVTKIPFLLKHQLREYQHIGLDWLVTMYDRKLNGILADEMGLGKTIQTIALLAHLACEKGNWGPHLIIVPTSVMLNWEMECKKWCPGFKILTYYGTQKERKQKRTGWTKPNAFHICITSYKLVIQDHQSFRRKKWKYLILDEAQNIKNFKSQRWQLLLNFQTQRRLLLTGTPLQNNLMELWSLMHFLMPNVFQSHREFKEWFSNPVTGMIEGNSEYNENIIRRLHKVLRPFLLRRLKTEVEKQLPKKYEHVLMCRLSKRQRYLYDDFMSRAKTKETLASGNLLSVINVLMQLRKVCNHPNLFEVRPTVSPFQMEAIEFVTASLAWSALDYDPFKHVDLDALNLRVVNLERTHTAFVAHRVRRIQTPRRLIEELDSQPDPPPRCPAGKIKINVRLSNQAKSTTTPPQNQSKLKSLAGILPTPRVGTSPLIKTLNNQSTPGQGVTLRVAGGQQLQGYSVQLVQHQGSVKVSFPVMTSSGQRLTVLSKSLMGLSTSGAAVNKVVGGVVTTAASSVSGRPVMRVPPLNVTTTQAHSAGSTPLAQQQLRCGIVTRNSQRETEKIQIKEQPKPEFYVPQLEEERRQRRQSKLQTLANINERRCAACPLYGEDLFTALRIGKPAEGCQWHSGWMHCASAKQSMRSRRQFFSSTEALAEAIRSTEMIVEQLKEAFERFVVYVPAVRAPSPRFHVSHPPPHKLWTHQRLQTELQHQLSPKMALFHPVASAMATQFPDPRLIQYDCGKLQSLDRLLRKLKADSHRVLIFTQMTRMLDVLEAFLNFHGHIYLRLDGTTRVDQRQVLMERFNGDKRIFCFILSTRSGGVGVNLTGADTVIFYDSDWNPTMDAQAQDRCHRIGQTRDVHIYRLVSEKTVEENILKKANQKRLLGDLAIEGGNFTTAYFKSSTIQDLFNIDQSENDASTRMAEVLEQNRDREKHLQKDSSVLLTPLSQPVEEKAAMGALENALAAAEEDLDVQAAKTAKAEAVADLAEFDENIPLDEADKEDAQVSKAEQEVQNLVSQLTPIERYAMKFVEESEGTFSAAQLAAAERELEQQKKEWELDRLRALREEEERRMRMADDDEKPLTFGREDAQNQVNSSNSSPRKLVNKKAPPSRRSMRRCSSKSVQESSESETETTTESDSESQEDLVGDSPDEESSHTESQSQGDEEEEEEEEEEGDSQNESESGGYSRNKNRSKRSTDNSCFDLNSPRTRSRGNVKINLWTLDVSPILPGVKPKYSVGTGRRGRRGRGRRGTFAQPLPPSSLTRKFGNIHAHESDSGSESLPNCVKKLSVDVNDRQDDLDETTLMKVSSGKKKTTLDAMNKQSAIGESGRKQVNDKTVLCKSVKSMEGVNENLNEVGSVVLFKDVSSESGDKNDCSLNDSQVAASDVNSELDTVGESFKNVNVSVSKQSQDSTNVQSVHTPKVKCKEILNAIENSQSISEELSDTSIESSDSQLREKDTSKKSLKIDKVLQADGLDSEKTADKQENKSMQIEVKNKLDNHNDYTISSNRDRKPLVKLNVTSKSWTEFEESISICHLVPEHMDDDEMSFDFVRAIEISREGSVSPVLKKTPYIDFKINKDSASTNSKTQSLISKVELEATSNRANEKNETFIESDALKESSKKTEISSGNSREVSESSAESNLSKEDSKAISKSSSEASALKHNSKIVSKFSEEPDTLKENSKVMSKPSSEPVPSKEIVNVSKPLESNTAKENLKVSSKYSTESSNSKENSKTLTKSSAIVLQRTKTAVRRPATELCTNLKLRNEEEIEITSLRPVSPLYITGSVQKLQSLKLSCTPNTKSDSTDTDSLSEDEVQSVGTESSKMSENTSPLSPSSAPQSPTDYSSHILSPVNLKALKFQEVIDKSIVIPDQPEASSLVKNTKIEDAPEKPVVSIDSGQKSVFAVPSNLVPVSTKSNICPEFKSRFRRPDTPMPGVTTRRGKLQLNYDLKVSLEAIPDNNDVAKNLQSQKSNPSGSAQDSRRITRLSGPQVDSPAVEDSNLKNSKTALKASQGRKDTMSPAVERITRSSANRPATPPQPIVQNQMKPPFRRRPDTPMPDASHMLRPMTRSVRQLDISSLVALRPVTRSSKVTSDNGFVVPQQYSKRNKSASKEISEVDSEATSELLNKSVKKSLTNTISPEVNPNSSSNTPTRSSLFRRRPDTPLPSSELLSRVTRSRVELTQLSYRSLSPTLRNKLLRKQNTNPESAITSETKNAKSVSITSSSLKNATVDTDSNGNSVGSENFSKHNERDPLENNDKPQRTAKVVAILTLDNLSNKTHSSKSVSSSMHGKKTPESAKKSQSENTKSKLEESGKSAGQMCSANSSMTHEARSASASIGTNSVSNKVDPSSIHGSKLVVSLTSISPKLTAELEREMKDKRASSPANSSVITVIDLNTESDLATSQLTTRLRKKQKRTRYSSLTKSIESGQLSLDEDEGKAPPMKRPVRLDRSQPPEKLRGSSSS
ncbi:helicase domino isoform X2 [Orussus abietinus]|uniref:helicase domino isoform X2 n=1 Tax=Orussus abietinus TaxID=222816 RepID=UPI000625CF0F|nr:helicase domino isoform X2 [Orussus abietinus]